MTLVAGVPGEHRTQPQPAATTAWVLALLLLMAFAFQGSRALWDPDEGRYTAVALQMLDSGDWLVPRLNDHQEHLTKPLGTYWALAASMWAFGHNEWAVRLPNALAFVFTGLLVFGLARRFVPDRPWLAAVVWGSSVLTVLAANVVSTDNLLTLFETAAMYAWIRSLDASGQAAIRWRIAMWGAFGLAFFVKGPPGLLPLMPVLFVSVLGGGWRAARELFDWRGVLILLALGGWWFAYLVIQRPELADYFLGHELRDRMFSDVHDRFPQWYGPFKVYGPIFGLMLLPWVLLRIGWISGAWRGFQPTWWRALRRGDPDRLLLLLWVLLPLLVFCISRSRLYLYVLPLAVPVSLLIARDLSARLPARLPPLWKAGIAIWCAAVLALKGYSSTAHSAKDAKKLAAVAREVAPTAERVLFSDVTARYGMRFYLGVPVEQVGKPHTSSLRARGLMEHDLCTEVLRYPSALIVTRGLAMGPRMGPEIPPSCEGIQFASLRPDSGLWQVDWAWSPQPPVANPP